MTRVYYMVGANGYYTRCNSYKGALEQQMIGAMNGVQYEIKTCYEPIEKPKPILGSLRQAMLKRLGRVDTLYCK